ncbi:DUF1129 family protein [Streptococcus iniae]
MWLDTSLLFIGMVSLLQGMLLFYNSKTAVSGLTALLALGFGGGASMYATYYFIYRHVGKAKSQRPSWFKIIACLNTCHAFLDWTIYWCSFATTSTKPTITSLCTCCSRSNCFW